MILELLYIACCFLQLQQGDTKSNDINHTCNHDLRRENYTIYSKIAPVDLRRRILQEAQGQPIRINFFQQKWSDDVLNNTVNYQYLNKLLQTTAQFFSDRINVTRVQGPLKFQFDEQRDIFSKQNNSFNARLDPVNKGVFFTSEKNTIHNNDSKQCLYTTVPQDHVDLGVMDTDLLIYVTAYPEQESFVTYSGACLVTPRPTFAQLHINTYQILGWGFNASDVIDFQSYAQILIHEVIHILGFSRDLYPFFMKSNGEFYGAHEMLQEYNDQVYMTFPPLVQLAQEYYKCSNMKGMILESYDIEIDIEQQQNPIANDINQIQSAIHKITPFRSSHWQRDIFSNEIMTESHVGILKISNFTLVVLQQTNWYTGVDLQFADEMFFGKGRGCDFVSNQCHGTNQYREYCGVWSVMELFFPISVGVIDCDYDYGGVGICYPALPYANDCLDTLPFQNYNCYDETNNDPLHAQQPTNLKGTLEEFSSYSRCFSSSLQVNSKKFNQDPKHRCYKNWCSQDSIGQYQVTVKIGQINFTCTHDGQTFDAPTNMVGQFACPHKLNEFCSNYQKKCPNFCSTNGYCYGGICQCMDQWVGDDCAVCLGVLLNGICISQCPVGNYIKNQQCQQCPPQCLECQENGFCTSCASNLVAVQIQNISTSNQKIFNCNYLCGIGHYQIDMTCHACPFGCKDCKNNQSCTQCDDNYWSLKDTINGYSCYQECPAGSYPWNQHKCQQCSILNCQSCKSSISCSKCRDGFKLIFDYLQQKYYCSTDCPSGYYQDTLQNNLGFQCLKCFKSCQNCISLQVCETCIQGYLMFNQTCLSFCPVGYYSYQKTTCLQCENGCSECENANDCQACQKGFILNNQLCNANCIQGQFKQIQDDGTIQCIQCGIQCKTCKSLQFCEECSPPYLLYQNQCLINCPTGFSAHNQFCIANNSTNDASINCFYSCQTCFSKSYDGCLSCNNSRILSINTNECLCSDDKIDTGQAQCQDASSLDINVQSAFQISQPITELATQAISLFMTTGTQFLKFGLNLKISDSSQKLGYVGYADMPLLGNNFQQLSSQQASNQPAFIAILIDVQQKDNKNQGRFLQDQSDELILYKKSQTYKRFGKTGILFTDIIPLVISWVIGLIIYIIVLIFRIIFFKQDCSQLDQTFGRKFSDLFQENCLTTYTIIFLGNFQEELLVIVFEIQKMSTYSVMDIFSFAIAYFLLVFHLGGSIYFILRKLQNDLKFKDKIRRVYGLISPHSITDTNIIGRIRKIISNQYILIKVIDKVIIVLLALFTYKDPNFLIYLFAVTLIFSIVINFSMIFYSWVMMSLSIVTDVFTLVIIKRIQIVQMTSRELEGSTGQQMISLQNNLSGYVSQSQSVLTYYAIYKIAVFFIELIYGLAYSSYAKGRSRKAEEDIEMQKFARPIKVKFVPPAIQTTKDQPEISLYDSTTQISNQFNSNSSQQSAQSVQILSREQGNQPFKPNQNQFNSNSSQQSAQSVQILSREQANQPHKLDYNQFDST